MKNTNAKLQNSLLVTKARSSIREVAKAAGVSKTTVSHVFSGRRPTSEEIRKRVIEAAKQLNYRPHYVAQALGRRKTYAIGLLVREATDQYFPLHLQAIEQAASKRGYRLSIGLTGNDEEKAKMYLDGFYNGQADGVLILTSKVSDQMIREIVERGFPVGTPLRRIPSYEELCGVYMDIGQTFRRLLEYLYNLGHRKFGFLAGVPSEVPERYEQMHKFTQEKGITFGREYEVFGTETMEEAEAGAANLLKRYPEITALVCTNDVLAVGALMAAHELGLKVPEDVSITGFDDVPISRYCIPRLTTVKIPIADLATITVNNLLDRIEGKEPAPMVKLPLELVIRDSSGPARKE